MNQADEKWRLFVALELPEQLLPELTEWQREIVERAPEELRAVRPQALHVTLAFLGDRTPEQAEAAGAALAAMAGLAAPRLSFLPEPVGRPERRPRLYAAELAADPALTELRAAVVTALEHAEVFRDEPRPFWPHVTLCRVRGRVRHHAPTDPPRSAASLAEPAVASRCTLFRSVLGPSGPRYEELASVELSD
ncbi:MAG TPA: RNA 2',3'-cyclic phosphodiesterase [Solirubrobacterales bacterium]|jgi:2'-5' RNA ligase|nr:RNA 2',3'-cyclic phosphodiesterase [Solirubrobacterales bacterium]